MIEKREEQCNARRESCLKDAKNATNDHEASKAACCGLYHAHCTPAKRHRGHPQLHVGVSPAVLEESLVL